MAEALRDKVAIVTGAGRGIGRGIALFFAREGAKVVVNDPGVNMDGTGQTTSPAIDVVTEIQTAGGQAVANHANVAQFSAVEAMVQQAKDTYGRLDIVATCAGILRDRMVYNMTEEEWDAVIAVHLKGTFNVVKNACIQYRQQRSGRIITFTSESGLEGNVGQANYGAAKAGIAGLTRVVARDMGRYGVTCNAIAPRAITRMTENVPKPAPGSAPTFAALGEGLETWAPEDVAPFAAYLASDLAADINGQIFLAYGNTIAIMSQPKPLFTVQKSDGPWSVEELHAILPTTVTKDLVNPAPAEPPRE